MGNIDFVGFTHGFVEIEKTYIPLPINAVKITGYADDMNVFNWIVAVVPIIVLFFYILIKKIKKYDVANDFKKCIQKYFDNKRNYNKKWKKILIIEIKVLTISLVFSISFLIFSMIFHELLHSICEYIFGKNVMIGFDVDSMIGYVKSLSPVYTKYEKITILVTPALITGVFPILICFLIFKNAKNKLIVSLLIILACVNISLCCSDFIDVYNYIKYVPNGAIIQSYDNETYYIPK